MTTLPRDTTQTHDLPTGYTARPVTLSDAAAVAAMANLASRTVTGSDVHRVSDYESFWQSPGVDLAANTRLVLAPDGTVAGHIEIENAAPHVQVELWGEVHPGHTRQGIGSYLVGWAEDRARAMLEQAPPGTAVSLLAEVNDLDARAQHLLQGLGYTHVRSGRRMVIDLDPNTPPPAPEWPAGVSLRRFVPDQDERVMLQTIRTAFRDHWGNVEEPFEEDLQKWTHHWRANPDFDPSLWFMAQAGGEVIGTGLSRMGIPSDPDMGWIFALSVLRPWRRQGVAGALLRHCFGELWQRGRRKVALGVDADNLSNAVHLYESAGMRSDPVHAFQVWKKELRPGREISTQG